MAGCRVDCPCCKQQYDSNEAHAPCHTRYCGEHSPELQMTVLVNLRSDERPLFLHSAGECRELRLSAMWRRTAVEVY